MEKTYIIKVNAGSKEFTYTGKIISQDNTFLEFEDKFGNKKDFPHDSCFIEEVRE